MKSYFRPLTHPPETAAINLTPDSVASFSCRCTTSDVIDYIWDPKAIDDVRSHALALKTGAGIWLRV